MEPLSKHSITNLNQISYEPEWEIKKIKHKTEWSRMSAICYL